MKQLKYISIISIMALITAPAVADIASAEYVDSVVVKYSTGNTTKAGITKLYTGLGSNSDGTMTQSAINTALSNKQDKLPNGPNDGKKYSLIWNGSGFAFEEFTTGGGDSTPIDWNAINDYLNGDKTPNGTFIDANYSLNGNGCESGRVYGYDEVEMSWFHADEWIYDCSASDFAGMTPGDWYVDLPSPINVKVKGRALCSQTEGTYYETGNPSTSGNGAVCWCKITSPAESSWVFAYDNDEDVDYCADRCAYECVYDVQSDSDFRSALFGSIE